MTRRPMIAAIGALLIAACTSRRIPMDGPAAVKQAVAEYYSAFSAMDEKSYRTHVTDDYLLLENGELLDFAGDVAGMPSPAIHPERRDSFDFRSVTIQGDVAYAVYFLSSETRDDDKGVRSRRWLESAVLRRSRDGWLVALLHSTKLG